MEKVFQELWSTIDQDRIRNSINQEVTPDYERDDAYECVAAACKRWLLRDLQDFRVTGLEEEVTIPGYTKNVIDVHGTVVSGGSKAFEPYVDLPVVIDWKTTHGALDKRWADRYTDSWQWKIYCDALDMETGLFIYRGIKRPANPSNPVEFREIGIDVGSYPGFRPHTQNFVKSIYDSINGLSGIGLAGHVGSWGHEIWPRNMPSACHDFGRPCEYLDECYTNTMPRGIPEPHTLSYSRIATFMACNERARRDLLIRQAGEKAGGETEESRFGTAVHAGLAEAYRQAYNL